MPQFTVNPSRFDPYKNFKFRVIWDRRVVAGISHVSALVRTTEVVSYRNGGDPSTVRRMPGQTAFEPITLERGVTHDLEFERWANKVWNLNSGLGAEVSLKDFRKDVRLELLNEAGQVVLAYLIFRCWVSRYEALPELDANATGVAIQSITLENEGWERDVAVVEPVEPAFDDPAHATPPPAKPPPTGPMPPGAAPSLPPPIPPPTLPPTRGFIQVRVPKLPRPRKAIAKSRKRS